MRAIRRRNTVEIPAEIQAQHPLNCGFKTSFQTVTREYLEQADKYNALLAEAGIKEGSLIGSSNYEWAGWTLVD